MKTTTNLTGALIHLHVASGSEIRWRLLDRDAQHDWEDVLADVARVAQDLPRRDRDAWDRACDAGRGPDADADIAGWRHVASESDWEDA